MSKAQWWEKVRPVQGSDEVVFGSWEILIGVDYPKILKHASVNAYFCFASIS